MIFYKQIILTQFIFACSSDQEAVEQYCEPPLYIGDAGTAGVNQEIELAGAASQSNSNDAGASGSNDLEVNNIGNAGAVVNYPKLFNIILSGQSNATGFGIMENFQAWKDDQRIKFYINATSNPLIPTGIGTHGLELSLGPALADLGSEVIIGKATEPGTICSCWLPPNTCWENKLLPTLKNNKRFGGKYSFVWAQGESDTLLPETTIDSYSNCIKTIISNVRNALEDQTAWVYIVLVNSSLQLHKYPTVQEVRNAQFIVMDQDPYASIVNMDNDPPPPPIPPDVINLHYSSKQELIMGRKVFMEMEEHL